MDQFDLLAVLDLLSDAPFEDIFVLLQFLFELLGELNHAKLVSGAGILATLVMVILLLAYRSHMLDFEGIMLLECLVAEAWSYLEDKVTEVSKAELVINSKLQEQSRLCESTKRAVRQMQMTGQEGL